MPLYDILNEFQKGSSHMAAVVKAKGKNKNPQIVGDGEKSEEYKAASTETTLTTPLLSRLDEKSDTVVVDIEKETSRQVNANGPASLQQHEAVNSVGSRSIEDIEDGEVIGIITLEDVFEELLQVSYLMLLFFFLFNSWARLAYTPNYNWSEQFECISILLLSIW